MKRIEIRAQLGPVIIYRLVTRRGYSPTDEYISKGVRKGANRFIEHLESFAREFSGDGLSLSLVGRAWLRRHSTALVVRTRRLFTDFNRVRNSMGKRSNRVVRLRLFIITGKLLSFSRDRPCLFQGSFRIIFARLRPRVFSPLF